jgi:hypothetical protein
MIISTLVYLLFFIQISHESNNGLGRTPQMGKRKTRIHLKKRLMYIFSLLKDGIVGIILVAVSMKP